MKKRTQIIVAALSLVVLIASSMAIVIVRNKNLSPYDFLRKDIGKGWPMIYPEEFLCQVEADNNEHVVFYVNSRGNVACAIVKKGIFTSNWLDISSEVSLIDFEELMADEIAAGNTYRSAGFFYSQYTQNHIEKWIMWRTVNDESVKQVFIHGEEATFLNTNREGLRICFIRGECPSDPSWDPYYDIVMMGDLGNVGYPILSVHPTEINDLILQEVNRIISEYTPISAESKISFEVIRKDDRVITVRFDGIVVNENAAYPRHVFASLSIDVKSRKILCLTDFVDVDYHDFLQRFIKKADDKLIESGLSLNDIFSENQIKTLLEQADVRTDMAIPESLSYVSNDSLVIRLRVPHVLGDFLDVDIPLSELNDFRNIYYYDI